MKIFRYILLGLFVFFYLIILGIGNVWAKFGALTIDDILAQGPTLEELNSIDADLELIFENDTTDVVWTSLDGTRSLTWLALRAYQAIIMMKKISFDEPLPWTDKPLYEWFTNAIEGIRFRSDITYSFCCNPANFINIQTNNLAALQTDQWIDPQMGTGLKGLMVLYTHEARHNEGYPHTCGYKDNTISELGAWGVQYYLENWLAYHSDPCFLMRRDIIDYYGKTAAYGAHNIWKTRFCNDTPTSDQYDPVPTCDGIPTVTLSLQKGINLYYFSSDVGTVNIIQDSQFSYQVYHLDSISKTWEQDSVFMTSNTFNAIDTSRASKLYLDLNILTDPVLCLKGFFKQDCNQVSQQIDCLDTDSFNPNHFNVNKSTLKILNNPDLREIEMISRQNSKGGMWESSYQFFGKPAGKDFLIKPYEIYFITRKK